MTTGLKDDHIGVIDTELGLSLVGVVAILYHAGILGILYGLVSPAAIASIIVVVKAGTVNQLLDREHVQGPIENLIARLHGAGSRESPAGATLALISDSIHCTEVPPVDI